MTEIIFKAKEVTKQYKKLQFSKFQWKISAALDRFDMEIHQGDIYGIVGANGAGKTTIMRIMAGLVFPTQGSIELFGESRQEKLYQQRYRMNGIIESPALIPSMTAQDNLEICRIRQGIKDKGCIGEVLKVTGLLQEDIKGVSVKNFSLGMKQRLGIAKALIGNPDFLFWDEPLNGLDPLGIVEFRELIKTLSQRGITILISSHLLRELDQVATCYGFVHKGKMIEQISANDLKRKFGRSMLIKTDNALNTEKVLKEVFDVSRIEVLSNSIIRLKEQFDKKGQIVQVLAMKGISVEEITIKGEDLENYYMSLIEKNG